MPKHSKFIYFLLLGLLLLSSVACLVGGATQSVNTAEPIQEPAASEEPAPIAATATLQEPTIEPTQQTVSIPDVPLQDLRCVDAYQVKICLPVELNSALVSNVVPEVKPEEGAPWDVAPEHILIQVNGYPLTDTFLKPEIRVYPIDAYKNTSPEQMQARLDLMTAILQNKPVPFTQLPFLPSFNAGPSILARQAYIEVPGSNIQGLGVITQFGQSFAAINNFMMFYTYQGITTDNKYWVSIILPLTHRDLQANGDYIPGGDIQAFAENFPTYVEQMNDTLTSAADEHFTPSFQSIRLIAESISYQP